MVGTLYGWMNEYICIRMGNEALKQWNGGNTLDCRVLLFSCFFARFLNTEAL